MKALICLTLAATAIASSSISFAQATAPVTRSQVTAELVRLEQAGYSPATGEAGNYPADIQAANAVIAAQSGEHVASDAVGGVRDNGTYQSGTAAIASPSRSIYFGN
jgi:hypothetical protein